jgi:hypothetical protein
MDRMTDGPNVRRAHRILLVTVVALGGSACTTALKPVPPSVLASCLPYRFRRLLVVTRSGYERTLVDAELRPDSVVGTLIDSAGVRFAIPVDEVSRLESEERDAAPAINAVFGFIGDAAVGFYRMLGELLRCSVRQC